MLELSPSYELFHGVKLQPQVNGLEEGEHDDGGSDGQLHPVVSHVQCTLSPEQQGFCPSGGRTSNQTMVAKSKGGPVV